VWAFLAGWLAVHSLAATRSATAPQLDGLLNESVWAGVPAASQFTQNAPDDGAAARARTEARVVFAGDAVYVGVRAFDDPMAVVAPVTRRDVVTSSDYVHVLFDTFHDRRTAFEFIVNPAGVKADVYHFDDVAADTTWDAVWDVAVARDSLGWTAEFRIPLSQLRYAPQGSAPATWGINFYRRVARTQEWSSWAPIPQGEGRLVSRFGEMTGITDLPAPRRRELIPYIRSALRRAPGDLTNPLYRRTSDSWGAGLDARLGLRGGFGLDLTIRPDFGEVDADPSELNLTTLETAFQERRPFFVENGGLFQLSTYESSDEILFYPRRIGRAPQLSADARGGFISMPARAEILGAAKLTGKTRGGWSLGAIEAVSEAAYASVVDSAGVRYRDLVEPATNYAVVRALRDARAGRTSFGVIGTSVSRLSMDAGAEAQLHRTAHTGGLDLRHRFGGRSGSSHEMTAAVFGSRVEGSKSAIAATQLAPAHRFQRVDADHLELDSSRTSMTGAAGRLVVQRLEGAWRWGNATYYRSPDFNSNDIGIQRVSDWSENFAWVGRVEQRPTRLFNNYRVFLNSWAHWTNAGERTFAQSNIDLMGELRGFWGGFMRIGRRHPAHTLRLRGGPLLAEEGASLVFADFHSPARHAVRLTGSAFLQRSDAPNTWEQQFSPSLSWRPSGGGRVTFTTGPRWSRSVNDAFFVGQAGSSLAPRWVVGRLDQTTTALTARIDVAFSPTVTLQLYAQPFLSAADYSAFKEVIAAGARDRTDRFRGLSATLAGNTWSADPDGDGVADLQFTNPAARVREFTSNAVLRWEYRPGSTLFVVWAQGRRANAEGVTSSRFEFESDARELFGTAPENVLLMKWNWWMSR
jgi:hypothetical protein